MIRALGKQLFACQFLAVALCVASVSALAQDSRNRAFKRDYPSVWKATVQSLVEGGDSITSQDKDSGTIGTDWFILEQPSIINRGWRVRMNIIVEKVSSTETRVSLTPLFQNRTRNNDWRPASLDNDYTPRLEKAFFEGIAKKLGG